ncbi:MAG: Mu-like prophage major head subunit gpT family protein [Clostridiaceae bacterium]|nr:Mu-like prophage major head subunit gpT family protein [Clostridiaceae bacterium]
MTKAEMKKSLVAQQRSIVDGSRAAGNAKLTAEEQRQWDIIQAKIDALNEIEGEDNSRAINDAVTAERQRIASINELGREFGVDVQSYIDDNSTLDAVRAGVLDQLKRTRVPTGTGVTKDETDKFREAAVDALCMRGGISLSTNPAEGANELRSFSLKNLAVESLAREGGSYEKLMRMDADTLLRQFYNPESSFPAILDATIRKSIVEMYKGLGVTFDRWTSKGSLSDFKESKDHEYILGSFSEFPEVPENGELEHDTIKDHLLPTRALKTYGKQFTMSRKAFIDDDIGMITKLPGKFAAAAKKTIEKQVYSLIFNNGKIFDGKPLFSTDHLNLIASGSAPDAKSIQDAILKGQKQKDPFGEAMIWAPKYLIVGVGYEFDLAVLFKSAQVVGSSNNDINPLYNYPLTVIQTPVLNALAKGNACPWFLVSDPADCLGIQVDYLNGNETPTVRRSEVPGTLGFVWDVWHDWGVTVRDYRGLIKNPGAVISE